MDQLDLFHIKGGGLSQRDSSRAGHCYRSVLWLLFHADVMEGGVCVHVPLCTRCDSQRLRVVIVVVFNSLGACVLQTPGF